jgi:hypothetical protein
MDYTERFLKRKGETATITSRIPVDVSRVILSPSSRSGWRIGERNSYWDGLILGSSQLAVGEVLEANDKTLIVLTTDNDPVSGQMKFTAAKKNADLTWEAQTTSINQDNNVIVVWSTVSADIPAYGQVVNASLIQEDPGLLPTTKYLFYIPDTYKIKKMNRVIFNSVSCQVDHIDDIILPGIYRLQCSDDQRT